MGQAYLAWRYPAQHLVVDERRYGNGDKGKQIDNLGVVRQAKVYPCQL
jgi:hypothetical protein